MRVGGTLKEVVPPGSDGVTANVGPVVVYEVASGKPLAPAVAGVALSFCTAALPASKVNGNVAPVKGLYPPH